MAKFFITTAAVVAVASAAYPQGAQWLYNQNAANQAAGNAAQSQSIPAATPQPAGVSANAPTGGFFESATTERMADKLFDTEKDSFDFENGTLNWKGKTFNVGNSRMVRARFERYLSTPVDAQNFEKYQSILSEIYTRLSASNDALPEEAVRACWSRLFDAAEYDVDGRSSLTIANLVYLSWRMRDEYEVAKIGENNQRKSVDSAQTAAKERAEFLEYANDKILKGNSRKKNLSPRTEGTADLGYRVQKLQEEVAELAVKKTFREATAAKAVLQFQSQLFAFVLERKFQQAQIASMFYRHIYRGNVQEMKVGDEQIKELFPVSNFVPVVDTFENVATEARKDIRDGMAAVNALYDGGERYGALERLMETFAIGEYDPVMATFPFEKRKTLHKIYRDVSALKSLADSRDWGAIEKILEGFETLAPDFPSKETLAKVRAAERISEMHVMAAKQAAALGKIDDVKKSLAAAMEAWPLNPSIAEFNSDLVGLASGASRYAEKFDELFARGSFREIAAEAPEYAIALRNDADRSGKLRGIAVKISQVDALMAQAEEFEKQGNKYFAWDILENAREIEPKDPKLALAVAALAPEVSDYVKMLAAAKKAELAGEFPVALNYYLAAQEIFPASRPCRMGIERTASKYAK